MQRIIVTGATSMIGVALIQNELGKDVGIIIELGYIRIGRGGGNGKCTGSRGRFSTIGMDTHCLLYTSTGECRERVGEVPVGADKFGRT